MTTTHEPLRLPAEATESARLAAPAPGSLVFSTSARTLLGRPGERWTTACSGSPGWADTVVGALAPGERAVGVIGFDPASPGVMHRLLDAREVPTTIPPETSAPTATSDRAQTLVEVPVPRLYADQVRAALRAIADGAVDKVVLGRFLDVHSDPPLAVDEVVDRLLRTRPGRYVFSVPVPAPGPAPGDGQRDATVLGASPELLVRREGTLVEAMPLAGSVPRSPDPAEDERRRAALASSAKDLHEHAFVVRDLVARLASACDEVEHDVTPQVVGTDSLWHLGTRVTARVRTGATGGPSALHLAQLLHPTPAVGGSPREAALALIERLETGERGYLAGAAGWVDGNGDGEFALVLRSGVLDGPRLRLFAGAGIVAGSDPDAEVRETAAKLRTMLEAVGL
ncbi:isochorismate synthase [Nocardioides sp. dk4132]|uniref:isochorismate synthase n=1 Tax=unclassified Nocardioides TaxID=2615069 RepID=UPI0012952080|nr:MULTISPECIES: isochorismate synthase [unclassified Nocardioides]MQW75281.1 isochorismate synthase [Nocardioides sp. dk4132]QGA07568.1 isochorismate synthase [Nocardioides sp. dk884]